MAVVLGFHGLLRTFGGRGSRIGDLAGVVSYAVRHAVCSVLARIIQAVKQFLPHFRIRRDVEFSGRAVDGGLDIAELVIHHGFDASFSGFFISFPLLLRRKNVNIISARFSSSAVCSR